MNRAYDRIGFCTAKVWHQLIVIDENALLDQQIA